MYNNSIVFHLSNKKETIDEININFNINETKLYEYTCIKFINIIFNNMTIEKSGFTIYNDKIPLVKFRIIDESILSKIENIDYLDEKQDCSIKLIKEIDNKLKLSKKVLK